MAHLQLVLAPGRDNDLGALPCKVLCYGGTQALQVPNSADGSETPTQVLLRADSSTVQHQGGGGMHTWLAPVTHTTLPAKASALCLPRNSRDRSASAVAKV